MIRYSTSSGAVWWASALTATTLAMFVRTIDVALREPAPPTTTSSAPLSSLPVIARADTTSDDLVSDAMDHDPFAPDRKRAAVRYGVPMQSLVAQSTQTQEALHLVGTVVDAGGDSFILCQLGSGPSRVIRVGQKVGSYQLRSIAQGTATFMAGDGQRVELRVPKAGT